MLDDAREPGRDHEPAPPHDVRAQRDEPPALDRRPDGGHAPGGERRPPGPGHRHRRPPGRASRIRGPIPGGARAGRAAGGSRCRPARAVDRRARDALVANRLPIYLDALAGAGRERSTTRVLAAFDRGKGESLAGSPWVEDPAGTAARWRAAGADGAVIGARTTGDVDLLVDAAGG